MILKRKYYYDYGASITEDEVRLNRQSLLKFESEPILVLPEDSFVQWSSDNVDHNLVTLDGKGTFHGMGTIASVTPSGYLQQLKNVRRLKRRCLVSEVTEDKGVKIFEYDGSEFFNFPKLRSLKDLIVRERCSFDLVKPETFWNSSWYFQSMEKPRPLWSRFMQQRLCSLDVIMLPIIDLQPTNLNCIYSTLLFIRSQADKLSIKTPVVTFDQPLWYKASGIIANKGLNIVCRLGGFHTLMSFMGSIGYMMSGSGLEEAWS